MSDKKENVEELVELAKQDKRTSDLKKSPIERFINEHDVRASEKKTLAEDIYWAYRTWCWDLKKVKPLSRIMFFKEFRKYFKESKDRKNDRKYHVDPEPFKIEVGSPEWWKMKKFYRDKREIKKRMASKKKSTKSSGESGPTETV